MKNRTKLVAALMGSLLFLTAAGQPPTLREPVYGTDAKAGDPIGTRNFADPSLLLVGRSFYAYSTSSTGADPRNIGVMTSRDLWKWTYPGGGLTPAEAMPNPPAWAWSVAEGGEFWAPTVGKFGTNKYVMYFGARSKSSPASQPTWCIGYATASKPEGPYTGANSPLFCRIEGSSLTSNSLRNNGAIDPQVFVDTDGTSYLHWKAENNPVQLWGVKLSNNGRSIVGAAAPMVPMAGFDQTAWEYSQRLGFTILENPAMDRDPKTGKYYMYYSGGEWQDSSYATGYATCSSPLGPCQRVTVAEPWLVSRGDRIGPGGLSVVRDAKGRTFAAFHSWEAGKENTNTGRSLHIEPLVYSRGIPKFGNKKPLGKVGKPKRTSSDFIIRGWAYDRDSGQVLKVRLMKRGQIIDQARATRSRPRPSAAKYPHAGKRRGFQLRTNDLSPGRYCVVALDDRTGKAKRIGCRRVG
ncbi:MAG: glycoside hydrolase family 43 protein [Acidimicrobiales bacterium]